MAAHVYWRLYITATGSDGFAGLAEWVPKDSGGSTIATTGGTASASTAYPGQPASNAFDGNASTFWLTNGGAPHWIQYQFPSAVDIASFTLTNPSGGNDPHCPMDFQLQFSDNGSTWTTLYTWLGAGFGSSGAQVTNTFNAANAAVTSLVIAWRLNITAVAAGAGTTCRIAEWKLYNASSTQITTTTYSASATSSFDGHQAPYLALDGNASTYWNSNTAPSSTPQNLQYSFGSSAPVASITIQGDDYTRAPSAFSLQYSTDGTTWTTASSFTATWTSNGQVQTFTLPSISVSPTSAAQGAAATLTVTGTGTHFVSGTTTVAFSGSGITVGTITVASATSLTVAITIGTTAATGARTLTVTTGSEAPTASFTVNVGVFQRGNIDYDQVRSAARQGAGSMFQMFGGGSTTTGHAAVFDVNGNVVDGGSAPTPTILPIRSVSANTTMTTSDYTIIATTPSITITLPASPALGQVFNVKNANTTTGQLITVSAAVNIDQATTVSLGATASLSVQWDGAQWRIL